MIIEETVEAMSDATNPKFSLFFYHVGYMSPYYEKEGYSGLLNDYAGLVNDLRNFVNEESTDHISFELSANNLHTPAILNRDMALALNVEIHRLFSVLAADFVIQEDFVLTIKNDVLKYSEVITDGDTKPIKIQLDGELAFDEKDDTLCLEISLYFIDDFSGEDPTQSVSTIGQNALIEEYIFPLILVDAVKT